MLWYVFLPLHAVKCLRIVSAPHQWEEGNNKSFHTTEVSVSTRSFMVLMSLDMQCRETDLTNVGLLPFVTLTPMHPYTMSFYIPQDWGRLCLILQRVEDAFYTLVREIRLYRLNKLSKEEKTPRCVKLKKCVVMWEGVSVCSHAACVFVSVSCGDKAMGEERAGASGVLKANLLVSTGGCGEALTESCWFLPFSLYRDWWLF